MSVLHGTYRRSSLFSTLATKQYSSAGILFPLAINPSPPTHRHVHFHIPYRMILFAVDSSILFPIKRRPTSLYTYTNDDKLTSQLAHQFWIPYLFNENLLIILQSRGIPFLLFDGKPISLVDRVPHNRTQAPVNNPSYPQHFILLSCHRLPHPYLTM